MTVDLVLWIYNLIATVAVLCAGSWVGFRLVWEDPADSLRWALAGGLSVFLIIFGWAGALVLTSA